MHALKVYKTLTGEGSKQSLESCKKIANLLYHQKQYKECGDYYQKYMNGVDSKHELFDLYFKSKDP